MHVLFCLVSSRRRTRGAVLLSPHLCNGLVLSHKVQLSPAVDAGLLHGARPDGEVSLGAFDFCLTQHTVEVLGDGWGGVGGGEGG